MSATPTIPRPALLRLHALRDLRVTLGKKDCPGFIWLGVRGYLHYEHRQNERGEPCLKFSLTSEGHALAAMVLK